MTVGVLFTELLRLLEIGTCKPSAKHFAISIKPYYAGLLSVSPVKMVQTMALQKAYAISARSGFSWDIDISAAGPHDTAQEELIGETILAQLRRMTTVDADDLQAAEDELIQALRSHVVLDLARAKPRP